MARAPSRSQSRWRAVPYLRHSHQPDHRRTANHQLLPQVPGKSVSSEANSDSMPGATGLKIEAALAHLATADDVMAALVQRHAPDSAYFETRDLFRSLTTAIVSQQLSSKAADTIIGRVEATLAPVGGTSPEAVFATG